MEGKPVSREKGLGHFILPLLAPPQLCSDGWGGEVGVRTGSHLCLVHHPLVMPHSQGGPAGHATQRRPFEGSKQQAGSIHKPCLPLKTNHRVKRDWVVASAGPSVTPFQRTKRWQGPGPSQPLSLCTPGTRTVMRSQRLLNYSELP